MIEIAPTEKPTKIFTADKIKFVQIPTTPVKIPKFSREFKILIANFQKFLMTIHSKKFLSFKKVTRFFSKNIFCVTINNFVDFLRYNKYNQKKSKKFMESGVTMRVERQKAQIPRQNAVGFTGG